MKKLIHIVRGVADRGMDFGLGAEVQVRRHPQAIVTDRLEVERGTLIKNVEFVYVDEGDTEAAVAALAAANPGYEVRVYTVESIAQCPAGALVTKKISESGVLPTFNV